MKNRLIIFSMSVLLAGQAFASEYLVIRNVDSWWSDGPGVIESASVLVEPKGIYASCTLILEIGAEESGFSNYDSLEADMNFRLPEGSEITDLVLWINDEPVQGRWYDKWTASLIYESIVQRRIDPAILTKVDANEFNIKIFPLLTSLKRKIQIRYLVPISGLMTGNPTVALPLNILKLSSRTLPVLKVACRPSPSYTRVSLREMEDIVFVPVEDEEFGSCLATNAGNLEGIASLNMVFTPSAQSNMELVSFTDPEQSENYYQLSLRHNRIFGSVQHRKALFLVDFIDENCSAYGKSDLLKSLEYSIRNTFAPQDSFNVLFSGMITTFPEENWVAADSASISDFFDALDNSVFNSYTNLPTLLIDGIEFIKSHGSQGSLVLISSSNSNGEVNPANALITDFLHTLEGTEIPIHIIDLDDHYYEYYEQIYIGGQYFRGNEYFYTRLSQLTIGEYYSVRTRTLSAMMEEVNHRISGYFKSLEVFIQTEGGYTYGNYKLSGNSGLVYNDEAFCMTGMYLGNAPFVITLFGQDEKGTVYQMTDTLSVENVIVGDSTLRNIWAAQKIRDLLGQERSNQLVNQIIHTSLEEHVLTGYTAILVLEPGFQIPDEVENPEDDLIPVSMGRDRTAEGFGLEVYPNPVTSSSLVRYQITGTAHVKLVLYDTRGQLVETLADETHVTGEYKVSLKTENLEKGIYLCVLYSDGRIMARIRLVVL